MTVWLLCRECLDRGVLQPLEESYEYARFECPAHGSQVTRIALLTLADGQPGTS
jgi:hypothetical protein